MEAIIQIFGELFINFFLELVQLFVPDKKFKKWQEDLLRVISVLMNIGFLACVIVGANFLADGNPDFFTTGLILTIFGAVIMLAEIIAVFVLAVKDYKKHKANAAEKPEFEI